MAEQYRNYYDLLGVPRNATKEQIRDAYKELARIYHPDSHFYDEILASLGGQAPIPAPEVDTFKLITEAYNTLSNEQSRDEYNRMIPSDLPTWEDDPRDSWHTHRQQDAMQGLGDGRYASSVYGSFGTSGQSGRSAFDEEALRSTRTVSELLKVKKGLWWRIRWLFFLEN